MAFAATMTGSAFTIKPIGSESSASSLAAASAFVCCCVSGCCSRQPFIGLALHSSSVRIRAPNVLSVCSRRSNSLALNSSGHLMHHSLNSFTWGAKGDRNECVIFRRSLCFSLPTYPALKKTHRLILTGINLRHGTDESVHVPRTPGLL